MDDDDDMSCMPPQTLKEKQMRTIHAASPIQDNNIHRSPVVVLLSREENDKSSLNVPTTWEKHPGDKRMTMEEDHERLFCSKYCCMLQ